MTNYRYTAVLATISNSFCDAILDYAVNRFNVHKVMFLTLWIKVVPREASSSFRISLLILFLGGTKNERLWRFKMERANTRY